MKKRLFILLTLCFIIFSSTSVLAMGFPPVRVYRLYNSSNQEHLYTIYKEEVNDLVSKGWKDEGTAWLSEEPDYGVNVYRLYCSVTGKHLYTTDVAEVQNLVNTGLWTQDFGGSPIFGGRPEDSDRSKTPVYRLYNPRSQTHLLTTDQNEYNVLPSMQGWQQEGIAFYAIPE